MLIVEATAIGLAAVVLSVGLGGYLVIFFLSILYTCKLEQILFIDRID
jgi:hypothetical protein